jgi:predicted Zn-dependent protease
MRKKTFLKVCVISLCLLAPDSLAPLWAQEIPARIKVLKEELSRNFQVLQKQPVPPYYIRYSIDEMQRQYVSAGMGAVQDKSEDQTAILGVSVRTGSYQQDNTHELRGSGTNILRTSDLVSARAPLDGNPEALAVILWRETDRAYKNAVETLSRVKSDKSTKIAEEDQSDDFSKVAPHASYEKLVNIRVDLDKWAARLRKATELFKALPYIDNSNGVFQSETRQKYLVDTEGTAISTPANYITLQISAVAKADDGMTLPLYVSYFGFKEADLPSEAVLLSDVKAMIAKFEKLRSATLVEPYTGPAILSGKASGVFFHEILGHRLEGHRLKSEAEGQTFKKKVGEAVLPEFMSVIFDPTMRNFHEFSLSGAYNYDEEGTKAEKVVSIENGILKDFLMSRNPVDRFPRSNGHARSAPGSKPVSRQSNLLVESKSMLTDAALRQRLMDECKKQNKPFGLLFANIEGGNTFTGRTSPNAFNVMPLEVYKVYTDGRPDELVRGVNLIGTPLTVFGKIIAAGSKMEVFNGTCGAESGSVSVSAISPSILVSEIEVQKKEKSQERLPILPPPPISNRSQAGGSK